MKTQKQIEEERRKQEELERKTQKVMRIIVLVLAISCIVCIIFACSLPDNNSSSYQLHNKDGSLNYEYINDMWEWQEKQKNK